jgi:sugar phosphate isomerase/epimerase
MLGVQSWCFRTYKTTPEVIGAVQAAGLNGLELCGVHLDLKDPAAVDAALAAYQAAGVAITAFGVARFVNDAEANRPLFEFAVKAGFPALSADPDPDALELVDAQCREYGVKLAVHNHGRKHRWGKVSELAGLFAQTSPMIGLCLDTAWMLDSGENPPAVAQRFADRLYGVHIKDFTFLPDGKPEDVIVGTGNLCLPELFDTLAKVGFQGYTTLEYEGDEGNPVPSVRECVARLGELGA